MYKRFLPALLALLFAVDASALPPIQRLPRPALGDRTITWTLLCSDRVPILGANGVVVTYHANGEYLVTPGLEGNALPEYLFRGEQRPPSKEWRFSEGGGVGPDGDGINTWMSLPSGVTLSCKRTKDE